MIPKPTATAGYFRSHQWILTRGINAMAKRSRIKGAIMPGLTGIISYSIAEASETQTLKNASNKMKTKTGFFISPASPYFPYSADFIIQFILQCNSFRSGLFRICRQIPFPVYDRRSEIALDSKID